MEIGHNINSSIRYIIEMDKEAKLFLAFNPPVADQAQENCMRFIPEACGHWHLQ